MQDHICKYDKEMGAMEASVGKIKQDTDKILKILEGNGSDGLVTRVALNKQSIGRAWWWIAIHIAGFMGLCWWVIKGTRA